MLPLFIYYSRQINDNEGDACKYEGIQFKLFIISSGRRSTSIA